VAPLVDDGLRRAIGSAAPRPLSGAPRTTRVAFDAARPLARDLGTGIRIIAGSLRTGFRVQEVECDLAVRVTGTDTVCCAWVRRGRLYRDVVAALAARRRPEIIRRGPRTRGARP
jgi:hypothetical protein